MNGVWLSFGLIVGFFIVMILCFRCMSMWWNGCELDRFFLNCSVVNLFLNSGLWWMYVMNVLVVLCVLVMNRLMFFGVSRIVLCRLSLL